MSDLTKDSISKMKVVDLRKELKSRGLPYTGDKAELINKLQAAVTQDAQDYHSGTSNLDSDELDSDSVLEDEDDKSQNHTLEDVAVDTLSEELVLADQPAPPEESAKPPSRPKPLKRKLTTSVSNEKAAVIAEVPDSTLSPKPEEGKETTCKKIVLVRSSLPKPDSDQAELPTEEHNPLSLNNKVKSEPDVDSKDKLEMRAKRFGLPVKMSDDQRKEARKQRFGQAASVTTSTKITLSGSTDNIDKLKKRAERFGQSVSKFMTDVENKEKLEKRKAKFGTVK